MSIQLVMEDKIHSVVDHLFRNRAAKCLTVDDSDISVYMLGHSEGCFATPIADVTPHALTRLVIHAIDLADKLLPQLFYDIQSSHREKISNVDVVVTLV